MTSAQLAICAIAAACGSIYGVQAVTHADITWKDIIGGGAVGAVLFTVMVFLRNISEMRKEHGDMVKEVGQNFATAVTSATKEFAESTQKIIEGGRIHNERNIEMIQQMLKDLRDDK